MYATNVRNLKRNPSEALRHAELELVLILKGNEPNAMLFNLKTSLSDINEQLKPALAASLFKDRVVSLGAAAKNQRFKPVRIYRSLNPVGYRFSGG